MLNIVDISKARNYELASALLEKMYNKLDKVPENKKRDIILSRKRKFQALLLLDYMIENGHVEGKINKEVYDMYAYCAKELGLQVMNKYDLPKLLSDFFNFTTVPKRFGDKIERVYVKKEQNEPKPVQANEQPKPYSVIGIEKWKAASADEKMQIVKEVCSEGITVSYDDYEMMLKFMVEQGEKQ